jgi:hypothetical protein
MVIAFTRRKLISNIVLLMLLDGGGALRVFRQGLDMSRANAQNYRGDVTKSDIYVQNPYNFSHHGNKNVSLLDVQMLVSRRDAPPTIASAFWHEGYNGVTAKSQYGLLGGMDAVLQYPLQGTCYEGPYLFLLECIQRKSPLHKPPLHFDWSPVILQVASSATPCKDLGYTINIGYDPFYPGGITWLTKAGVEFVGSILNLNELFEQYVKDELSCVRPAFLPIHEQEKLNAALNQFGFNTSVNERISCPSCCTEKLCQQKRNR